MHAQPQLALPLLVERAKQPRGPWRVTAAELLCRYKDKEAVDVLVEFASQPGGYRPDLAPCVVGVLGVLKAKGGWRACLEYIAKNHLTELPPGVEPPAGQEAVDELASEMKKGGDSGSAAMVLLGPLHAPELTKDVLARAGVSANGANVAAIHTLGQWHVTEAVAPLVKMLEEQNNSRNARSPFDAPSVVTIAWRLERSATSGRSRR